MRGLRRMLARGSLKLGGRIAFLQDSEQREAFLEQLEAIDCNVFIHGRPRGNSDLAKIVKYLADYLTGGPISDRRMFSASNDEVWFRARPKQSSSKKRGLNAPQPYCLSVCKFVQRWALHVLSKDFIRSRSYGGYHSRQRAAYLQQCLAVLQHLETTDKSLEFDRKGLQPEAPDKPTCIQCATDLTLVRHTVRPSWRHIFERDTYRTSIARPNFHLTTRAPPDD